MCCLRHTGWIETRPAQKLLVRVKFTGNPYRTYRTCINVNGRRWNACKLVFLGTRIYGNSDSHWCLCERTLTVNSSHRRIRWQRRLACCTMRWRQSVKLLYTPGPSTSKSLGGPTTHVNSVVHPSGVGNSLAGLLGWVKACVTSCDDNPLFVDGASNRRCDKRSN